MFIQMSEKQLKKEAPQIKYFLKNWIILSVILLLLFSAILAATLNRLAGASFIGVFSYGVYVVFIPSAFAGFFISFTSTLLKYKKN